jgi:predicted PurR-regulated permease PerM
MIRGRLRRRHPAPDSSEPVDEVIEIDAGELSGLIALPDWLRNMGLIAWLTTGVILLLVGLVWLLSLAHTIVLPLITAGIVAAVGSPLVRWLNRRGLPRAAGAGLLLVAIVVLGATMVLLIVGGIASQTSDLSGHLSSAESTIAGWLKDLGIDPSQAKQSAHQAGSSGSDAVKALLDGVAKGIAGLSGLAFFLALTVLSLFFLLKDGPTIRSWTERQLPVPLPVAKVATQRVLQSLRGYFLGVSLIAAYNALVVGIGALVLGVPLVGTIVVVTFVGGFIPYLGAWSAGIFAFLIALGGAGTQEAIGMAIVLLLANGVLQQVVQPFAYGAALGIHPLAVLVVTIGGGAIFGAVGLILAAPLTSAIVRISADMARARAAEAPGPAAQAPG